MSFEVFGLKIVSTLSFFQTNKDVDLCSASQKPFEVLYKYTAPSDDVQRLRTIIPLLVLTEWCPFVLETLFCLSVVVHDRDSSYYKL